MEGQQLDAAFDVAKTMLNEARSVGEMVLMATIAAMLVFAAFVAAAVMNAWNARAERQETKDANTEARSLQEKLNEQIANSHDKMAEAICKMADSDARSVECQERIQMQVLKLHEQHLTVFGVVDEALAIAEEYGPSDSIRAGAKRIRNKLERHRD